MHTTAGHRSETHTKITLTLGRPSTTVAYGVGGSFALVAMAGLVAEYLFDAELSMPYEIGFAAAGFVLGALSTLLTKRH